MGTAARGAVIMAGCAAFVLLIVVLADVHPVAALVPLVLAPLVDRYVRRRNSV